MSFSVSTSRSSNRTGRFPASGSRTRITISPTSDDGEVEVGSATRVHTPGSCQDTDGILAPALQTSDIATDGPDVRRADARRDTKQRGQTCSVSLVSLVRRTFHHMCVGSTLPQPAARRDCGRTTGRNKAAILLSLDRKKGITKQEAERLSLPPAHIPGWLAAC